MKNVCLCSQNTFDAVAEVTDIVLSLTLQGEKTIFVLKIMMTLTYLFDLLTFCNLQSFGTELPTRTALPRHRGNIYFNC